MQISPLFVSSCATTPFQAIIYLHLEHDQSILTPCFFKLYAEHIMKNAGLEEAQAGIKIPGRNINNLKYVDDTTLMAESEERITKEPLDESERRE